MSSPGSDQRTHLWDYEAFFFFYLAFWCCLQTKWGDCIRVGVFKITLLDCQSVVIIFHWLHLISTSSVPMQTLSYLTSVISLHHSSAEFFPMRHFIRATADKNTGMRGSDWCSVVKEIAPPPPPLIQATLVSEWLSLRAHGRKYAHRVHHIPSPFLDTFGCNASHNYSSLLKLAKCNRKLLALNFQPNEAISPSKGNISTPACFYSDSWIWFRYGPSKKNCG